MGVSSAIKSLSEQNFRSLRNLSSIVPFCKKRRTGRDFLGAGGALQRASLMPEGGLWTTRNGMPSGKEARERNSRLQQLIEIITQLVARSRDVLRRQRPEDSAPVGNDKDTAAKPPS